MPAAAAVDEPFVVASFVAATVAVSFVVVSVAVTSKPAAAASRPATIAGAEGGSRGPGPARTPAAAAVAVSFIVVSAVFPSAPAAVALRPASVAGAEGGTASSVFTSASAAASRSALLAGAPNSPSAPRDGRMEIENHPFFCEANATIRLPTKRIKNGWLRSGDLLSFWQ
jgi:hypothetical protein